MKRPAAAATLSHEEAEEEDGEEEKGETPVNSPADPGSKLKVRFTPERRPRLRLPQRRKPPRRRRRRTNPLELGRRSAHLS